MGDGADHLNDIMEGMIDETVMDLVERGIWTQKNGREIRIRNMTAWHLKNTIRLLERTGDHYGYIPQMREELHSKTVT